MRLAGIAFGLALTILGGAAHAQRFTLPFEAPCFPQHQLETGLRDAGFIPTRTAGTHQSEAITVWRRADEEWRITVTLSTVSMVCIIASGARPWVEIPPPDERSRPRPAPKEDPA